MNKKIPAVIAMALITGTTAFSNIPLIEHPDFTTGYKDSWILGANRFPGGVWLEYVIAPSLDHTNPLEWDNQLVPTGSGFTMSSWDDGESDRIELYLLNEHKAASPLSTDADFHTEIFEPGDVIRFTGSARATRTGADTSDITVRAFIKTLGYNPDAFFVFPEYTQYHTIGSTLESWDITITYPDDVAAEPFQVIQVGFEISTEFDNTAFVMDSASIYFENIDAYIERDSEPVTWAGYTVDESGYADTGDWMGMVYVTNDPWIYVYDLGKYVHIPTEAVSESGAWIYTPGQ